jgi:nonribosomal peptide synthetase DhbF
MNVYGQTEANSSTYFTVKKLPENDDATLPAGKTLPNYDVLLLGDGGRPIRDVAVEGELYVIGGAVASGYYKDEERTSKVFVQHPLRTGAKEIVYKTGDRFMFDANGDLIFRGRMDSAVKVRGFRVELGEVEAAIAGFPEIEEVAVIPVADEALGHSLVAFVAGRKDAGVDESALLKHVAAKLPRYMLPASVVVMRALPRTPNGKIDRRALEAPASEAGRATIDL